MRRGAWYSVRSVGLEEVVIEVRDASLIVPRSHVEVVPARPNKWTLVWRHYGGPYAVCPECAERMEPACGAALKPMRCPRCAGAYEVAIEQERVKADYGGLRFRKPAL